MENCLSRSSLYFALQLVGSSIVLSVLLLFSPSFDFRVILERGDLIVIQYSLVVIRQWWSRPLVYLYAISIDVRGKQERELDSAKLL